MTWEDFAKENEKYYISTGRKEDVFWQSGKENFSTYIEPLLIENNVKQ